jgi:hypothetical protein
MTGLTLYDAGTCEEHLFAAPSIEATAIPFIVSVKWGLTLFFLG